MRALRVCALALGLASAAHAHAAPEVSVAEPNVNCPTNHFYWGLYLADHLCVACPRRTHGAGCANCAASTCTTRFRSIHCPCVNDHTWTCAAGKYYEPHSDDCEDCAVGKYQSESGKESCDDCDAGYHTPVPGLTSCLVCSTGQYSLARSKSCTTCPCDKGKISVTNGPNTTSAAGCKCESCEPGTITTTTNQFACDNCPAGKFQKHTGHYQCDQCYAGQYAAAASSSCKDCDAGRAAAIDEAGACAVCEPGKYAWPQATLCTSCPEGKFAAEASTHNCNHCPKGKTTHPVPPNAAGFLTQDNCTETMCNPGDYIHTIRHIDGTVNKGCVGCPAGYFGNMKPVQNTVTQIVKAAKRGKSKGDITFVAAASSQKITTFQCYACPPGKFENKHMMQSLYPGTYAQRTGGACFSCPSGQYQDEWGQRFCLHCESGFDVVAGKNGETKCIKQRTGFSKPFETAHTNFVKAHDAWLALTQSGGTEVAIKEAYAEVQKWDARLSVLKMVGIHVTGQVHVQHKIDNPHIFGIPVTVPPHFTKADPSSFGVTSPGGSGYTETEAVWRTLAPTIAAPASLEADSAAP